MDGDENLGCKKVRFYKSSHLSTFWDYLDPFIERMLLFCCFLVEEELTGARFSHGLTMTFGREPYLSFKEHNNCQSDVVLVVSAREVRKQYSRRHGWLFAINPQACS